MLIPITPAEIRPVRTAWSRCSGLTVFGCNSESPTRDYSAMSVLIIAFADLNPGLRIIFANFVYVWPVIPLASASSERGGVDSIAACSMNESETRINRLVSVSLRRCYNQSTRRG